MKLDTLFSFGSADHHSWHESVGNHLYLPPPPLLHTDSSMSAKKSNTYDPARSCVSTDKIIDWCQNRDLSAGDDMKKVPGVGPKLEEVLRANGVDTIAQLLARFLTNVDGERNTGEVCQTFFSDMKALVAGTSAKSANMHAVTFAVANFLAERGLFKYDLSEEGDESAAGAAMQEDDE